MKFKVSAASENYNSREAGSRPCDEATGKPYEWYVEITSMAQLMDFIDKYGDIVIYKKKNNETVNQLTIYDDYIE